MIQLGDLDPNIIVSALIAEVNEAQKRAEPGMSNFQHEMTVARVLTGLAISINTAILHATRERPTDAPSSAA